MNCDNVKDLILDSFGDEQLPENIAEHLKSCDDCRNYYNEIKSLSSDIKDECLFNLTDEEFDSVVGKIEKAIDQTEIKKSKSNIWRTYIPAAAAVILLLGVTMMTRMFNGTDGSKADIDSDTLYAQTDLIEIELTDDTWNSLMNNSEELGQYYNGVEDELTEEEYDYLSANLEVGDIL